MEGPLCPPSDPGFRLIETFRWVPDTGILRHARHLSRLRRSAAALGIVIVAEEVEQALSGLDELDSGGPLRVRLTVDAAGRAEVTTQPFVPLAQNTVWNVAICQTRLNAADPWLRVKTTCRALYDQARADMPAGTQEIVFLNQHDEVCEGSITNVFARINGQLVTPALRCGLLPGILREELLDTGAAVESVLTPGDLAGAEEVFVGNSLRGLIRCSVLPGEGR